MKFLLSFFIGFSLLFSPSFSSHAAGLEDVLRTGNTGVYPSDTIVTINDENTAEEKTLKIFLAIVQFILYAAGIVAVIMIVLSGVRWTISAGGEEEIDGARRNLLYALLGLIVIFLAFMIVENIVKVLYGQ